LEQDWLDDYREGHHPVASDLGTSESMTYVAQERGAGNDKKLGR